MILAPLFAAVAGLLALAGALKLRAPARGAEAYPAPGAALGVRGARTVGAVELALGVVALVAPGRLVAAVIAAAFAAFAAYTVRLLVAGGGQADCGCFGEGNDGTLGRGHVALDLACAAIAAAAAIAPPPAIATVVGDAPLAGAALAAGVAAAVYALYLAYTVAPLAWRAYAGATRR